MRRIILEATALTLIGLIIISFYFFPKKQYSSDQIIVAFGDSITSGYGTPPGKNFVTFLSEDLDVPIINAGQTGDTTAKALLRLNSDILDKKPNMVLLFLGANDFLAGYSETMTDLNLRSIISAIKKQNVKIILIGANSKGGENFSYKLQKIYSDGLVDAYIPNILNGILFRKDLLFDNIHPNEKGHREIASRILPVIKKLLN